MYDTSFYIYIYIDARFLIVITIVNRYRADFTVMYTLAMPYV